MPASRAAQRKALTEFGEKLTDEGYVTETVWADEDANAYDMLVVKADSAAIALHQWRLELAFLPFLDPYLTSVAILQCFAPISVGITAEAEDELNRAIVQINTMLPAVGFGFMAQTQTLFFKHNAFMPDTNSVVATRLVGEIVPMVVYLLENFAKPLYEVANEQKTAQQALEGHLFASVYAQK